MTQKKLAPNLSSLRWLAPAAIAALAICTPAHAQDAAAGELEPFTYLSGQAVGGKSNYQRLCADCHGNDLEGTAGPALSGATFSHWLDAPVIELFTFIQDQMPAGAGGTLSDAQVATIIAHIGKVNGLEQGRKALPTNPADLEGMKFGQ